MLGAPFDSPSACLTASRKFAHGKPFDTSNALSERSESKGQQLLPIHFHSSADDGIVVRMWFLYMLRCSNGSPYAGETNDVAQRVADHNRGRGSAHTARHAA